MANYVYSTLANTNTYHVYDTKNPDLARVVHSITIKGGAGIATKHLHTPMGIATAVSDDDLALLMKDEVFQTHLKNGFVKVSKKKTDPEVVAAADMTARDESAPIVPEDSDPKDKAQPSARNGGKVKNVLE